MTQITLYQFESCPFCKRVRDKLAELKLDYKTIEVPYDNEHPLRQKLFKESGVSTVPVIEIDGKYIGESQDIIEYLETL